VVRFWYALGVTRLEAPLEPLLLAALISSAQAGLFTPKRMQGEWPERQVERPWVLPKGWTQVSLSYDHKIATGQWNAGYTREAWRHNTRWDYGRMWLRLDHGVSRHMRLFVHLPVWVHARLRNDFGTDTSTHGLGDAETGLWVQPWLDQDWHAAYKLFIKAPSGVEWPSDYVGGSDGTSGFILGTGITNVGLSAHHRWAPNRWLKLEVSLGGVVKLPAVTGYVLEDEGFGNGWFDPGDEGWAELGVGIQVTDDVALYGHCDLSARANHRMGVSGPSTVRNLMEPMLGTSGVWIDVEVAGSWEPWPQLEVGASAKANVLGGDTSLLGHLGLEELAPQPGWTLAGSVTGRW
jgi:hypothetical protein